MEKHQYNQGDILQRVALDPWEDSLLAVIIRVFDFHGFDHYELRWTDGQPSFLNRVNYIDSSTAWRLYARGQ